MRQIIKPGLHRQLLDAPFGFPAWFNAECINGIDGSHSYDFIPIQDPIHKILKMRNRWLNKPLKFGKYDITPKHVLSLVQKYSKEKHNLTKGIIYPTDRQNFDAVLKICDDRVINLLPAVNNSEGTIFYLRTMQLVLRSYLDCSLDALERVRYIWFPVFMYRIWKRSILNSRNQTLKDNFFSNNCYSCIEINAHSLVLLLIYLKENNLDHLFYAGFFGSQQCEAIFRQFRSFTSTYSTKTNCSVFEMLHRLYRIELLNEISHIKLKKFTFPRIGKHNSYGSCYFPADYHKHRNSTEKMSLPTRDEIIRRIELAKAEAIEYAETLGIKMDESYSFECELECEFNVTEPEQNPTASSTNTVNFNEDSDKLQLFSDIHLKDFSNEVDINNIRKTDPYESKQKRRLFVVKKHRYAGSYLIQTVDLS